MKKFIITEEVLRGVIAYLMTRPYSEVSTGIDALSKLPLAPETETVEVQEDGKAV